MSQMRTARSLPAIPVGDKREAIMRAAMATNWILSKRRYKLAPMADEVLDIFLGGVSA